MIGFEGYIEATKSVQEKVPPMKVALLSIAFGLLAFLPLCGQSSQFMDRLSSPSALSCEDAAYLVLSASGGSESTLALDKALSLAQEKKWLSAKASAERPISLAAFSHLAMSAFGLSGGLMYSLAPGPRYAFRELVYRGVVVGRHDPDEKLDGPSALRILNAVAALKGVDL